MPKKQLTRDLSPLLIVKMANHHASCFASAPYECSPSVFFELIAMRSALSAKDGIAIWEEGSDGQILAALLMYPCTDEIDDAISGATVKMGLWSAKAWHISHVTISPWVRGEGMGARLLTFAEGCVVKRSDEAILASVVDDNTPSSRRLIRFWERLGYHRSGFSYSMEWRKVGDARKSQTHPMAILIKSLK